MTFFLSLLSTLFLSSWADLAVTPTRLDLNEKTKSASVTLVSQAKQAVTYKIGWIHFTMKSDGSYEETKEARADSKIAEEMIRYSPRQVRLEPGETQTVRLSVRKPTGLKDGEYRTHLVFRADPTSFATGGSANGEVSVNLMVAKGVAIPVVVRQGSLTTETKITSAKVTKTGDATFIVVDIERKGSASPFGDIEVRQTIGGKEQTIALIKGIALFLEIPKRTVRIPLLNPEQKEVSASPLHVVYQKPQDQGAGVLAEARFNP